MHLKPEDDKLALSMGNELAYALAAWKVTFRPFRTQSGTSSERSIRSLVTTSAIMTSHPQPNA